MNGPNSSWLGPPLLAEIRPARSVTVHASVEDTPAATRRACRRAGRSDPIAPHAASHLAEAKPAGRRQRIPSNRIHLSTNNAAPLSFPFRVHLRPGADCPYARGGSVNLRKPLGTIKLIFSSVAVSGHLVPPFDPVNPLFHPPQSPRLFRLGPAAPARRPQATMRAAQRGDYRSPCHSRNQATKRGIPTASGVVGAKPVSAAMAAIEARVSATSARGRGA
jgi:hypothetical protein